MAADLDRAATVDPSDTLKPGLIKEGARVSETGSLTPISALREVAFWLERSRADTYRVRAYRKAADALEQLSDDDRAVLAEADAWTSVPGLGAKTATIARAAAAGQVPPQLAKLRDEGATPLADGGDVRAALKGDLHTHTTWSDGGSPLWEMVLTAQDLGHEYLAITDHSPRLTVAHGLSAERLAAQWDEIAAVQAGVDITILRGGEIDILEFGALDQTDAALDGLDVVVASVHSLLRSDAVAMTHRMVAAIANPHTNILGHCTGRLVEGSRGTRPESQFDAEVVFEACRSFGVAVEINSRPERRDPPMRLLQLAAEIGCYFSIDTDAHAPGQLDFQSYGCERAVAAGVDPARVINTWPLDRLLSFCRKDPAFRAT